MTSIDQIDFLACMNNSKDIGNAIDNLAYKENISEDVKIVELIRLAEIEDALYIYKKYSEYKNMKHDL